MNKKYIKGFILYFGGLWIIMYGFYLIFFNGKL